MRSGATNGSMAIAVMLRNTASNSLPISEQREGVRSDATQSETAGDRGRTGNIQLGRLRKALG